MSSNNHRQKRGVLAAALLLMAAVGLAGCGSADAGEGEITVGVFPVSGIAPFYYADDKGYFEDEGLKVSKVDIQSPPDGIANLASGRQQFALINCGSVAGAISQGLDLRAVAAAYYHSGAKVGEQGLYAMPDSGIDTPKDLEGKTVGLAALNNNVHAMLIKAVADDGGDPEKVKFTLIAVQNIPGAIQKGTIDAGQVIEPFLTMNAADLSPVIPNFTVALTEQPTISGYVVTTAKYADDNPETVKKFKAAWDKGIADLSGDENVARKAIASYTEIEPEVVSKMVLPEWNTDLGVDNCEEQIDIMADYDMIKGNPDLSPFWGQ
ncbi:hypothetical protein ASG90_00995 [Nocardioides sp. Soil797]|nr:hypothetical protein ASG90_00995 [Nocardioides sp. Soil797]